MLPYRAPKPLLWLGSALSDLRRFPVGARQVAGFQLWRVQRGLLPNDWRPIAGIGRGVQEIRIHTVMEHRVIYVAAFPEGVYVLHAFQKRTRKTAKKDIEIARQRLERLIRERERG